MNLLGILSGTIIIGKSNLFQNCRIEKLDTEFGRAVVFIADNIILIPRHGNDPQNHILPHLINHRAHLRAFKNLGVTEVIGINSTGSLKRELQPGMIVIPDDFLTLTAAPSIHKSSATHISPSLNEGVRRKLIKAARNCNIPIVEKGIYWQTTGPRLETKAEIKMMSNFADIVGMTMASEAVIAQELDLPYASVCSIDNFGNGLLEKPLNIEEIITGARKNTDLMIRILESCTKIF